MSDARKNAAEYVARRDSGEQLDAKTQPSSRRADGLNARNLPSIVETAIQQAIRQGAFDNLPGAGKPLEGLGGSNDPDWWIRRKIEAENLTGLGPPALRLRVEHQRLEAILDRLQAEAEVREYLEDFNARVIEARRQLLGGPPVVTPLCDVDTAVVAWAERREARQTVHPSTEPSPRRRWFTRRRR